SAVSSARARPVTEPITVPGKKRSPSRASGSHFTAGSSAWKAARARSRPATISSCFATRSPHARALSGTITSLVRSPRPRSSSRAARTRERTRSGSSIRLAPRSGFGPALRQLAFEDLEGAVLEPLAALDREVLDPGGRDRVFPDSLEEAKRRGVGRDPEPREMAADGGAGLALGAVDRPQEADGDVEARPSGGGRPEPCEVRGGRPRRPVDAAGHPGGREPPRPRLFGHVRQERREEPQEDVQAELQRGHRGAAPLGILLAARARLHQLHVRVGEAVPEEALDEIERGRVLERVEGRRRLLHGLAQPEEEAQVEIARD